MPRLGVNLDHIATIREARKTNEPDPIVGAYYVELAGAHGVTIHLREDRRHIQDRDVHIFRQIVTRIKLNLEMAATEEMVSLACDIHPDQVTLVPEKRQEVTTEGGLDVISNEEIVQNAITRLKAAGIETSLFVDPTPSIIEKSAEIGADAVELHTGSYALAIDDAARHAELGSLIKATEMGRKLGLVVHAGHGLTYQNVLPVARIPSLSELNIGHSIISRAVMVGLERAVKDMLLLISDSGCGSQ